MEKLRPMDEFFKGRVVFLTGASGFLGRMCLERLLRPCLGVKRIYVLLRAKKDKDVEQRMDHLLSVVVFDAIRETDPDFRQRIKILEGDCTLPDLGLTPEARGVLVQEVDVVIHWAATVNFDENLKIATNINVRAVRDLLRLAREMTQLKSFLHCSTAYSHCVRDVIDEEFYPAPLTGDALIAIMDNVDEETAEKMKPILLKEWPNTYVFTKAVSEWMIRDEGKGLPIGIVRPSMVLGTYKEPVPGWIDNVYGPTGTMLGMAIGLIRIMRTDLSCNAEVVPGDYVLNTSLAAIVDIHDNFQKQTEKQEKQEEVLIYNIVSTAQAAMTWGDYTDLAVKHCNRIESPKVIYHSIRLFTTNPYLYQLGIFFLHFLPAYMVDLVAMCIGRKPFMVKAYDKIHHLISTVYYFGCRDWVFKNLRVQQLYARLTPEDQKAYDFNFDGFDWDDYFKYYTLGGRKYILQDKTLDTIPAGRRKVRILRILHYSICALLLFLLYKLCSWLLYFISG